MPTLPPTYTTRRRDHIVVAPAFPDGEEALRESPTPDPDLDDLELIPVVTGDGVGAIISVSLQPRCIDRIFHRLILWRRAHSVPLRSLPRLLLTKRDSRPVSTSPTCLCTHRRRLSARPSIARRPASSTHSPLQTQWIMGRR